MICPKCGAEYQDGYTECADCRIPLVEPEQMETIVWHPAKLTSTYSRMEADMIEAFLRDEGISVMRKALGSGDYMNIIMGFSIYGEDIYVDRGDYEKAEGLLTVLREAMATVEENPETEELAGAEEAEELADEEEPAEKETDSETAEVADQEEEESASLYRADTETRILLLTMLGIFGILVLFRLFASLYILFQTAV